MSAKKDVAMLIVYAIGFYGVLASSFLLGDYLRIISLECTSCGGNNVNIMLYRSYHEFLGFPIPAYSAVFFGLFMVFSGLGQLGKMGRESVFKLVIAFSLLGLIFGIYLIYVMLFVLKELCWWCLSMDFVLALLLSFSIFKIHKRY